MGRSILELSSGDEKLHHAQQKQNDESSNQRALPGIKHLSNNRSAGARVKLDSES